ncbi:MAG: ATP-binding cassette domain-containing protein [Clostridia bacterium]|nr:ATP-binding cassette domain-containing protein [Ruminococcus sp.]MBQ9461102.1 ATP-binding cassette domain-containing protein [Clostridia bacterium]
MSVLRVEDLVKRYGKKTALRGITCEFTTGINAFLGPNGAGKTTIMNCISGVIPKTGGGVFLDGVDVFKMGKDYRRKLGYQFQSQPFYPGYTAHDFLELFGLLKGIQKEYIDSEIKRVLELVNLSENLNDKIRSFSGGMKQRLAIAQTIMGSPDILIFDEPSAGLDPFEREQFKRIMMELKDRCIIIISTHIVSDIDTICDRLVVLNKGSVIANDCPDKLCRKIEGLIWSIPRDELSMIPLKEVYFEDTNAKTVSETKPTPNAVLQTPTLNDLYFCGQLRQDIFAGGETA